MPSSCLDAWDPFPIKTQPGCKCRALCSYIDGNAEDPKVAHARAECPKVRGSREEAWTGKLQKLKTPVFEQCTVRWPPRRHTYLPIWLALLHAGIDILFNAFQPLAEFQAMLGVWRLRNESCKSIYPTLGKEGAPLMYKASSGGRAPEASRSPIRVREKLA